MNSEQTQLLIEELSQAYKALDGLLVYVEVSKYHNTLTDLPKNVPPVIRNIIASLQAIHDDLQKEG